MDELVKPTDEALAAVLEWLVDAGIDADKLGFSKAKDWIKVDLPVESVERLLDTEYSVFEHTDEESYLIRTPKWSLPMHLHPHIDTIQPTNNFMKPRAEETTLKIVDEALSVPFKAHFSLQSAAAGPSYPDVSDVCDPAAVTPECLRTLYGTVDYTPQSTDTNFIALTNYLGEVQARRDVRLFLQAYRPDAVSAADTFEGFVINNGPPIPETLNSTQIARSTGLEGSLDAETIIGITYPTHLIAYSTGGSPPFIPDDSTPTNTNEPYLEWLQFILAQSDDEIPYTVSTSYGEPEQTIPYSYATRVCSMFAQLGARGVTSLHSSGDTGVGRNGSCISNDGTETTMFLPNFPASCPWLTTVGGTMDFAPEVAAFDPRNGYSSGGGFSNYFAVPEYQQEVVSGYISSLNGRFDGYYNQSGRGYPDLAAQSVSYIVAWNGRGVLLDGTSASCPAVASVVSLLNDARLAAGMSPLGFLNPLLYSTLYTGLHDITSGSAIGCSEIGDPTGFPATEGWDAVTGFGTPVSVPL